MPIQTRTSCQTLPWAHEIIRRQKFLRSEFAWKPPGWSNWTLAFRVGTYDQTTVCAWARKDNSNARDEIRLASQVELEELSDGICLAFAPDRKVPKDFYWPDFLALPEPKIPDVVFDALRLRQGSVPFEERLSAEKILTRHFSGLRSEVEYHSRSNQQAVDGSRCRVSRSLEGHLQSYCAE